MSCQGNLDAVASKAGKSTIKREHKHEVKYGPIVSHPFGLWTIPDFIANLVKGMISSQIVAEL